MSDQVRQIAQRVKELREISDLTVAEVASKVELSPEEYEAFITTLIDLELVTVGSGGRRGMPLVDESALAIGKARLNGSKGGRTAARNRQR